MRLTRVAAAAIVAVSVSLLLVPPIVAHHGSAPSYDIEHPWTTKATVTAFHYVNPHPWLEFDHVNDKGQVEHWIGEMATNPTFMLREGWTKSRSIEALKPGTVVVLSLATARVGGFSAILLRIQTEKGDVLVNAPLQGAGQRDGRGGRGNQ